MSDRIKKKITLVTAIVCFVILSVYFFFAYFMPVQNEHSKIAGLPSHDLTLFIDEHGDFAYNGSSPSITYHGQECRTEEDIISVLNNDTFAGSSRYYYFYDSQHNLFMKLGMGIRFFDGEEYASYSIDEYVPYSMKYENYFVPLWRTLALGPLYSWHHELSGSNSTSSGTISAGRYQFLYSRYPSYEDTKVSVFSASLQLALAFTLYLIPLIVCLLWRRKKVFRRVIGIYVLLGIVNLVYYLCNYQWLSW